MKRLNLLIEIGTEELPPKSLKTLSEAFTGGICRRLDQAGIAYESASSYATPRRLAVLLQSVSDQQATQQIEKRGPALKAAYDADGKPTRALEGFARSCGATVEQMETLDTDKGAWVVFRKEESGKQTIQLIPGYVDASLSELPIPKRMRWGSRRVEFVRPVHWIVMMADQDIIPAEILGLPSGNVTFGHRFHHPEAIQLNDALEYPVKLQTQGFVVPAFEERRESIRQQIEEAAKSQGLVSVIDEDLLDEVTALNEYPNVLLGRFEERFLSVPQEALISTMKENQKYFHLVNESGQIQPFFITISNIKSQDPQKVIEGNERVVRPRLSDAAFFFETDKKKPLYERLDALKPVVFQQQLGSLFDRALRISQLSGHIAKALDQDFQKAERAGLLAKADLTTAMVLEFPEMQGIAGRYYAALDKEDPDVAQAIEEHYLPRFAGDSLPTNQTGTVVALAEKLDTLTGIFGIGQPPSGTKDPFALRRAALSVLRLLIENGIDADLKELIKHSISCFQCELPCQKGLEDQVSAYIIERLRSWYEEQNIPAEVFLCVNALGVSNPVRFNEQVKAVRTFLTLDAAEALISANKRVANLLEKSEVSQTDIRPDLFQEAEEKSLFGKLQDSVASVQEKMQMRDYTGVLEQLSLLRQPLDAYFDKVMVMADDPDIRNNRLAVLGRVRELFLNVADISLLQGIASRNP